MGFIAVIPFSRNKAHFYNLWCSSRTSCAFGYRAMQLPGYVADPKLGFFAEDYQTGDHDQDFHSCALSHPAPDRAWPYTPCHKKPFASVHSEMAITLKIRGIYSTALTKFFIDNGLTIVSPSKAIVERFRNYKKFEIQKPIGVEIKDIDGGQRIFLIGEPDQLDVVVELIKEAFFDVICRKGGDAQLGATEVEFPYLAKSDLDDLRNRVIPTVFNHHRLRIIDSEYVDSVEKKELLNHPEKRKIVSQNLEKRLIWETYKKGKKISIEHVKLNGRVISLSEGKIIEINPEERKLTLKRTKFTGRTKYDGLNLPKKNGDYAITEVKEGDWFYGHTYFRYDGQLIGKYYNINTLVEFYPDKIRYVDLEIDVVKWPDGKVEIIDEEILNRQFESGYLSEALKQKAKKTAHELKSIETPANFVEGKSLGG